MGVRAQRYNERTTSIILDAIEREGESPVFRKRLMRMIPVFAALAVLIPASGLGAQDPRQDSSSKPSDNAAPAPAPAKKPGKSNKDSATKNAPDQPTWDPLRAEKDIERSEEHTSELQSQ